MTPRFDDGVDDIARVSLSVADVPPSPREPSDLHKMIEKCVKILGMIKKTRRQQA